MNLGIETEHIEFEESLKQLRKGIESIVAMLNRSGNAVVYFGVNDKGDVIGLEIGKETIRSVTDEILNHVSPRIFPSVEPLEDGEKRFLRVSATGVQIPYSAYGVIFLRCGTSDTKPDLSLIRKMVNTGGGNDPLKESPSPRQDLHFTQLKQQLLLHNVKFDAGKSFPYNFKLLNGQGEYNLSAYLLSDENDAPLSVVRYSANFKDASTLVERKDFGNRCLLLSAQQVLDYVSALNVTFVDKAEGRRKETHLFDYASFYEAWINAVIHNDWFSGGAPSVAIFTDRMEILSQGGLPYGYSKESYFLGIHHPINQALQDVFDKAGYSDQNGLGVPTIYHAYGESAFEFGPSYLIVKLKFSRALENGLPHFEQERLTPNQKRVYAAVKENPYGTIADLSLLTGISRTGVQNALELLRKTGKIQRVGSKRTGHWEILSAVEEQ